MSTLASTELIARLGAVRRSVRRRLVAYGVFAVIGGGALALLTVIALDWLLWLPGLLRAMGLAAFVAGSFGATYYWVVKPLRARLGLDEIASRLEKHFAPLGDRLSSSVNFLEGTGGASEEMAREVISDTERMIKTVPLESALSLEPVAVRGSLFGVSMVALLTLLIIAPQWVRTGAQRYLSPWGEVEWPRRVQIIPITGDQVVPLGESVSVAMHIGRGLRESLRGIVHVRSLDGATQAVALQRGAEGAFFARLDSVTENLEYWFEAGDDSTERYLARITVVSRPEVVEATALIEPPAYARQHGPGAEPRTHDLLQGPADAVIGSRVMVTVRPAKPIADPHTSGVGLVFEDDVTLPLTDVPSSVELGPAATNLLRAEFRLEQSVEFRIELRDEHGLQNRGAAACRITAHPDAAPQVAIIEPQSLQELTTQSSLPLSIQAEDDLGIRRLRLVAHTSSTSEIYEVDLSDRLRQSTPAGASKLGHVIAAAEYVWTPGLAGTGMKLAPGDVITYEAVATDTFSDGVTDGQIGRSNPQQIRIISEAEFDLRLREQLSALEARIRQAALEQQEIRDRTDALARMLNAESGLSQLELSATASLGGQQARLAQRIIDIAAGFAALSAKMEQNQAGDARSRDRLHEIAAISRHVATGSMSLAEAAVSVARDSESAADQRDALELAVSHQTMAADELRALLGSMSAWGTFQGLVSRTRDLLERQTTLQKDTTKFGKESLGKAVEALQPEEAATLARLQRQQEQLSSDVDQHLARMRDIAEGARLKQPAAADSVDSAIRAARAHEIDKHLQSAAKAIGENRTAAATVEQRTAAEGLRKMIASLREREKRELEELRKKIVEAQEQVAWLLEHQESLQTATIEAGAVAATSETFRTLEGEQRTLTRNTSATAEELSQADSQRGASLAAEGLRQAIAPMETSAQRLAQASAGSASSSQQEAIDLLRRVLEDLQEAAQAADQEIFRHSLENLQDQLAAIVEAQTALNDGLEKLEQTVRERGDVGRAEAWQASKLAKEQGAVRDVLDEIVAELKEVPVFEWALRRAAGWMETIQTSLEARTVNGELVALAARIVQELQKLIGAIAETLALPTETEFAEAEGNSGESAGDSAGAANIPPVAELLVLKAMQMDINERTRKAAGSLDPDNRTEEQIRGLSEIAADQAQVRRLTELVTKKARHPQ